MDQAVKMIVHCYAEGAGNEWEAFCLDFDLAVQGRSFRDVFEKLNDQVELYFESVQDLPVRDQRRLLRRSAPTSLWLRLFGLRCRQFFGGRRRALRHTYDLPVDACFA